MGNVVSFPASGQVGESRVERHRHRFFDRKWLRSAKGNPYVQLAASDGRGATVTVFRVPEGWRWSIVRSAREGPIYARQAYATALEARAAAWSALTGLEEKSAPDEVRAIIAHRCPELTDDDLAALAPPGVPAEVGEMIVDVLAAMEAKLDAMMDRLDTLAARLDKPAA
jgi:hypothetical protein